MSKLDSEQAIIKLAAGLQVDWQKNAVQNIVGLCHEKISKWLKNSTPVRSIKQLEILVCKKLKLVFEEVWDDDQLNNVIRKYVRLGEVIFATLKDDLNDQTFATLIERRKVDGHSEDRYVAVIDCRGQKGARRFFTRWHEIAHLLTLQGQLELPLHRSTTQKDATERLMDVIAGEVGFYEPIFTPILNQEIAKDDGLNFETVERIRERFCSEASYHSTLNASISRSNLPVLLITIGLGYKKEEERQLQSPQNEMFPVERPTSKLRVLTVAPSAAARGTKLQIHRNMQVPEVSLLFRMFHNPEEKEAKGTENLSIWRHSSDGKSLAHFEVSIRARRIENTVIAIVAPAHAKIREALLLSSQTARQSP
jgi:hypothetical protein